MRTRTRGRGTKGELDVPSLAELTLDLNSRESEEVESRSLSVTRAFK